jgi:FMN phosphatase YigB (HAD superfamily)
VGGARHCRVPLVRAAITTAAGRFARYRLTCDRLGVAPEHVVFLDDRTDFVEGALETGMRSILYEDNDQAIAELEAALR